MCHAPTTVITITTRGTMGITTGTAHIPVEAAIMVTAVASLTAATDTAKVTAMETARASST